jgi:hypothetical protein
MARIRGWELSEDDWEEIETGERTRQVIRTYRRMLGRELGDEQLREYGIDPPEDWTAVSR